MPDKEINQQSDDSNAGKGGSTDSNKDGHTDVDNPKWDEETLKYIKSLRQENAKHRTEAKGGKEKLTALETRFSSLEQGLKKALGLEDDSSTPEQKIENLQSQVAQTQFSMAIKDIAIDNGVSGRDNVDYLEFLIAKASEGLKENEDLSEDAILACVEKAKKLTSGQAADGKEKNGGTSVDGQGTGKNPGNQAVGPSVEEFAKMSVMQKSEIFTKNRSLYDSLMAKAREKRLI
jgi:hypothetical protein